MADNKLDDFVAGDSSKIVVSLFAEKVVPKAKQNMAISTIAVVEALPSRHELVSTVVTIFTLGGIAYRQMLVESGVDVLALEKNFKELDFDSFTNKLKNGDTVSKKGVS